MIELGLDIYPIQKGTEPSYKFVGGVYLHGKLCDIVHTDLFSVEEHDYAKILELEDGIYNVFVHVATDTIMKAVLHFWKLPPELRHHELRGLICLEDDVESMEEAKRKFDTRAEWL